MSGSDCNRLHDRQVLDPAAMGKLRAAAEEIAWLVGRSYPLDVVRGLVQRQHGLDERQLRAVERGMCSDAQYRRHVARELDAEDVAKRPLRVDGFNVLGTVAVALRGGLLVAAPDGTLRDLDWERGQRVDGDTGEAVLACLSRAIKKLRPSKCVWYLDASAPGVEAAGAVLATAGKKWRVPVEVVVEPDVATSLRASAAVATSDAGVLDACGSWFNLAAYASGAESSATVLRLQGG